MTGLLSPTHLAVVLAIVLIVFGPKRLPELGRAIGHGMRSFKSGLDGDEEDAVATPPASTTVPAAPAELARAPEPATHPVPDAVSDAAPPTQPAAPDA